MYIFYNVYIFFHSFKIQNKNETGLVNKVITNKKKIKKNMII